MKIYVKKAWEEFQRVIASLSNEARPEDVFLLIRDWLIKYDKLLLLDGVKEYSLQKYVELNINYYPIRYSSLKGEELTVFKRNVALSHRDLPGIARIIRDTLEQLIIVEADEYCPQCGKYGLGVYQEPHSKQIVLECNQCGYAMYKDKHLYDGKERLLPATEESLQISGYI
ncbi:Uncharacterised protein [Pragia fontium]|uniref:hypothetical protein n=1 Tax=Pragia fontium TaxID=82985 RepID=UPI000E004EF5|nr:hypothetical protein [Pragia fontium]SUB83917.1 Uncharacterised protein [Pragia fontium]